MSEIKGLKKARKRMQARSKAFKSRRGPYAESGKVLAESINKNFNAQGRPSWKARAGVYSHPILDKSGKMRDKAETDASGPWRISGTTHTLQIHSPLSRKGFPYGIMHQIYGIQEQKSRVGNKRTGKRRTVRKFIRPYGAEFSRLRKPFRAAFLQKRG